MFSSRFMPCAECGDSVERSIAVDHRCNPDRVTDYRMFELRPQVADFDRQLRSFLASSRGRFETWLAAREVKRRESGR